jgi:sortase A
MHREIAVLLLAALALGLDGLYIPLKAALAQQLLERAWQRSLQDGEAHPPWPWADTRPVARLLRVDGGDSQIVLAGDSGRVLAFGPGWSETSASLLSAGTAVISAHRDTHFAWLREITDGELIELSTATGARRYRLAGREIVDVRHQRLQASADDEALLLVTCWPFGAVDPRGPLRLMLRFEPLPGDAANDATLAQRGAVSVSAGG